MTCEVPLWRDAREDQSGSSGQTMREVIDRKIRDCREDKQFLATALPTLRSAAESVEAQALLAALEDAHTQLPGTLDELQAARSEKAADRTLTFPELVVAEGATADLRTMAMAQRLARLTNLSAVETTAGSYLAARLDACPPGCVCALRAPIAGIASQRHGRADGRSLDHRPVTASRVLTP